MCLRSTAGYIQPLYCTVLSTEVNYNLGGCGSCPLSACEVEVDSGIYSLLGKIRLTMEWKLLNAFMYCATTKEATKENQREDSMVKTPPSISGFEEKEGGLSSGMCMISRN
uniref:GekBS045P n=1 Tax=Gekko japonicus TaxID=146911 RepID=Q66VE7_GEKJA|nr:GekBS045P [Gekko japonicus]